MFNQTHWLSPKTKSAFFNKLSKIKKIVGAVDTIYNQDKLDRFYKDLDIEHNDTLLVMEQKIKDFNMHNFFYGSYTGVRAIDVNALNDLTTNSICELEMFLNNIFNF